MGLKFLLNSSKNHYIIKENILEGMVRVGQSKANLCEVLSMYVEWVNLKEGVNTVEKTTDELWDMIEWLNCELEKRMPKEHPVQGTEAMKLRIYLMLADNRYIDAIKSVRQSTSWGLKQAKNYVDGIRTERNREHYLKEGI